MAKDPAFLFYSQDWLVGTNLMSWEDRGKFITILSQMHQSGRMDEETICFLVGSISDKLKSKFRIDDKGLWYNERLELEAEKRSNFTESRRENGKKGGRPKKESTSKSKKEAKENLMVNHMDSHMGNENENENRDKNNKVSDLEKTEIRSIEVSQEGVEKIITDSNGSKVLFQKVEPTQRHPYTHELMKAWGLNPFNQHKAMVEIDHWVKERESKKELQYAKDQLTAYSELKKISSQVRCGWKSWISEKWNENNYEYILDEAKKLQGSKSKDSRPKLKIGVDYGS